MSTKTSPSYARTSKSSSSVALNDASATTISTSAPAAIDVLRTFLSRSNGASQDPQRHTANTLRALYISAKSRSQLYRLDPARLSSLISLFGTLSMHHPQPPLNYTNPLVSCVTEGPQRSYWPFIVQIIADKEHLGQTLTHSDRYWAMRAHIVIMTGPDRKGPSDSDLPRRLHAFLRARIHYNHIAPHSADPEVHATFLEALLSFGTAEHLREADDVLHSLLSRHDMVHSRLLKIFSRIILDPGRNISRTCQERLLSVIWDRIVRQPRSIFPLSTTITPPTVPTALGVMHLAAQLSASIFSSMSYSYSPGVSLPLVQRWSVSQTLAAFAPEVPLATRWNNLILLMLYHAPPTLRNNHNAPRQNLTGPDEIPSHWRLVFALANLEKALVNQGIMTDAQAELRSSTREVVRSLWYTWTVGFSVGSEVRFLSRAVIGSFFRLSTLTVDTALKDACYRYCSSSDLWLADDLDKVAKSQVRALATEYAVAAVICGSSWEDVVSTLSHIWLGPKWRTMMTTFGIRRLARLDVLAAHQLFLYANANVVDIPSSGIRRLGTSLASHGFLDLALPIFNDSRLSNHDVEVLLGATLSCLAQCRRTRTPRDTVATLGVVIQRLYTSSPPPPGYRNYIEYFLRVMVVSQCSAQAMSIVRSIHAASSDYFTNHFFMRFLHTLLSQRQFRLAARVMSIAAGAHPTQVDSISVGLLKGLSHGGAHRLAFKAHRNAVRIGLKRPTMGSLLQAVNFRTRSPSMVLTLKLLRIFHRSKPNGRSAVFTVSALVHTGRVLAARKLFAQNQHKFDPAMQTALGNIILHGTLLKLSKRNGRLMRKLLATLDFLIKKHGFTPDRVTVNILLKAVLRWRNMIDSDKLRALFDHMVRTGYPAGGRLDHGCVPFDTPASSTSQFKLPKLPPFMCFEKHVRPLYKMFIKAFHMRGDVLGARTVIGILKAEERKSESGLPRKRS